MVIVRLHDVGDRERFEDDHTFEVDPEGSLRVHNADLNLVGLFPQGRWTAAIRVPTSGTVTSGAIDCTRL